LNKKLKIAIIGSRGYPYVYSGYETLVKELSERLVKKGHNVRVYCHRSLFYSKPNNINGIELVYTPSIQTKSLSQFTNSFFSFLHVCLYKVDIILVLNSANGPFGLITKIFGIKTCINVDGLEWLRPKWKGLGSFYFKFSSKLSTLFFDEIITDSIEMKNIYRSRYNRFSTVIAYGSTMVKCIKYSKYLNNYNLKKNDFYLIVGRLIPDNNVDLIINGYIKSNTSKKLVVVGDVPYKDDYSRYVKSKANNKIKFLGYVRDQEQLTILYKNSYCYIHGHEFGGTNPTMINALDLNCKIIALNTVFNKEMLINKKSILFEKNIKSISKTIDLVDINKESIDKDYVLPEKFCWDNIANSYLKLFQKIIKKI